MGGIADKGQETIEGFAMEPLKQFVDDKGAVLHMLRRDSPLFSAFGEIYFSEVLPFVVKAWKRHREMTQHFAVPAGRIRLVLYDDRPNSTTKGRTLEIMLGRPDAYNLVRIPPRVWYGFQGVGDVPGIIANCTDIPHDPMEAERLPSDASGFPLLWDRP